MNTKKLKSLLTVTIVAVLALFCIITRRFVYLKAYSVVINSALLVLFASSLAIKPNICFKFACLGDRRVAGSSYEGQVRAYCKKVTIVWCAFFIINGSVAAFTTFYNFGSARLNNTIWAAYNCAISYVLMGTLFAIELIVRHKVDKSIIKSYPITKFTPISRKKTDTVCYSIDGSIKTWGDFLSDTATLRNWITSCNITVAMVHIEDYYYFLITLVALLQKKCEIHLTQNTSDEFLHEVITPKMHYLTDKVIEKVTEKVIDGNEENENSLSRNLSNLSNFESNKKNDEGDSSNFCDSKNNGETAIYNFESDRKGNCTKTFDVGDNEKSTETFDATDSEKNTKAPCNSFAENEKNCATVLTTPLAQKSSTSDEYIPITADETKIYLYTSGSTGKPKKVLQRMTEFEADNAFIIKKFGDAIKNKLMVSTVSAHHIYGFLFGVTLPFALGISFRRERVQYLEEFEKLGTGEYLIITTPAFLKRVVEVEEKIPLKNPFIFTSGGACTKELAQKTSEVLGFCPLEVYGSTETSGVAYRQQNKDGLWFTPFDNAKVWLGEDGCLRIISPYIKNAEGFATSDLAQFREDGKFLLKGRADSIVKIEEKRISLTEVENRLTQTGLIKEAKVIALFNETRQYLAAALVLNEAGKKEFLGKDKYLINRYFHDYLMQYFENVTIPKRWRYLEALPADTQGKKHKEDIEKLFAQNDGEGALQ